MMYLLKNADGDTILQTEGEAGDINGFIGLVVNGQTVASVQDITTQTQLNNAISELRRQDRREHFSNTIDLMNAGWWSTLTTDQKNRFHANRRAWLDWPNNPTVSQFPSTYEIDDTSYSTFIGDIFFGYTDDDDPSPQ